MANEKSWGQALLGILTATGLLDICKYINPNIMLIARVTYFKNLDLLVKLEPLFTLMILLPLAVFFSSKIKISKTFQYSFWVVLLIEYMLYLFL